MKKAPFRGLWYAFGVNSIALAAFVKPFAYFLLFVLVVAPITWVLWRVIPDSRLKVFLFQVRHTEGEDAEPRDVAITLVASLVCYAALFAFVAHLLSRD